MPVSCSSWIRVRCLVRLISSLVVSRSAGSFTPTLSIRHPQRLPEPPGSRASQWSGCLLSARSVRRLRALLEEDFTEERGQLTLTMKVRRQVIMEQYAAQIAALYDETTS